MSLKIFQKAIASNLLGGNFATQHATSMHNKVNAVDPSVFLPQTDAPMVETLQQLESMCKSELMLDLAKSQCTKPTTAITRVGNLVFVEGFSKLCVNIDIIVAATTSATGTPIICQLC